MNKYPTGQLAQSLIEYHVDRIHTMERELALVKQENEMLKKIVNQQLNPTNYGQEANSLRPDQRALSQIDY